MVKKSKLLLALDAHKNRDYGLERQKKLQKAAEKRKRARKAEDGDGDEEGNEVEDKADAGAEQESEDEEAEDSDGGAQLNGNEYGDKDKEGSDEEEDEEAEEDEDEEDIPLSDLSGDETADVIPHQRLTINNSAAIRASLKRISFINSQTPFSEHQSLVSTEPVDVPDPNDDLKRELAFYSVCVSAAKSARDLLKKEGVPFSRPKDYFAEMVKSDEHMGKVKKKLYDEAAAKKASAEARRQRDLKKFGKQVQVAKLQQRDKEKRETLEKINSLKRKRKSGEANTTTDEDLFDISLDNDTKSGARKGGANDGMSRSERRGGISKRQKKDQKFGYGGKKRFAKSGDAVSSGDMRGFAKAQKKGGASKRLGKSRRGAGKS